GRISSRYANRTRAWGERWRTSASSRSNGSAHSESRAPWANRRSPWSMTIRGQRRYTQTLSSNRQTFLFCIRLGRYAVGNRESLMYRYDHYDDRLVGERVAQFRDLMRRFLAGELTEDEFRPLRLHNGLYIQKHAPMLRIAIPYGVLSSKQLRKLAHIARKYDRGYGHFTTRQNLQLNWPRLEDVP